MPLPCRDHPKEFGAVCGQRYNTGDDCAIQMVGHFLPDSPWTHLLPGKLLACNVDDLLLDMASDVPDLEFVLNVRDWPQVHFLSGSSGPVFSYSITARHLDIMYSAWSIWTTTGPILQHYPHGVGRWDWMRKHLAASASEMPWNAKRAIGFFMASRSSPERDSLVRLAHRRPDLVDAQYTKLATDADPEKMLLVEHCQFRYRFNIRGVAASFPLRHILLCRLLLFHVGDQWQEFFYSQLKPWVHYVPVASEVSRGVQQEINAAISRKIN